MSNARRLRRPAKRAAARAVAAASQCPDCGATAARPRREKQNGRRDWVIDLPHEESCPARRLPGLRDSVGRAAVAAARPASRIPLAYVDGAGVVICDG